MSPAFWRGRRVFLTGDTGFKGAWLALWLRSLGADVLGFAKDVPTDPSLFQAARIGELVDHRVGDVRELASLKGALADFRPDIVFHLAAQSLVRYSYEQPIETYATNVLGTAHLLEVVRHAPSVLAAVIVTSDKCYENRESGRAYVETDPMGGNDPYSSSKGAAELVTAAYRRSYFSDKARPGIASARAGNVIGGGDWSRDRLLPDAYRAAASRTALRIRNPGAVRPWQHVLEPLGGYLLLAQRLAEQGGRFGEGWNFGPPPTDCRPVAEVVDRVVALWDGGLRWERDHGAHPHEATLLSLDCGKAHAGLGWKPRITLDAALEWTVAWYRAFIDGADARRLCEEQIARYGELEAA